MPMIPPVKKSDTPPPDRSAAEKQRLERIASLDPVEASRQLWQQRAGREISREEARAMTQNLVGFFKLLHQWSLEARTTTRSTRSQSRIRRQD